MERKEKLTIQEVELLCQAYIDCHLSLKQEKELELILLASDLSSPLITEARALMGMSTLMSLRAHKDDNIKKNKLPLFKYSAIAACFAIIMVCAGYFYFVSLPNKEDYDVYACVDGKILTGHEAQTIVNETEKETMRMYRSIIEEAEAEQRITEQYINE